MHLLATEGWEEGANDMHTGLGSNAMAIMVVHSIQSAGSDFVYRRHAHGQHSRSTIAYPNANQHRNEKNSSTSEVRIDDRSCQTVEALLANFDLNCLHFLPENRNVVCILFDICLKRVNCSY